MAGVTLPVSSAGDKVAGVITKLHHAVSVFNGHSAPYAVVGVPCLPALWRDEEGTKKVLSRKSFTPYIVYQLRYSRNILCQTFAFNYFFSDLRDEPGGVHAVFGVFPSCRVAECICLCSTPSVQVILIGSLAPLPFRYLFSCKE